MNRLSAHIKSLLVGLCGIGLVLASPIAVLAIEDGGIGGKPANPRADNPRSESIFVYELAPGTTKADEVQVINNTSSAKTLLVYAVDSQVASGGAFSCAQHIDEPVSVGGWIRLAKTEVKVAPHAYENVGFTITVPQTASAGESNGCIVVQDAQRSAVSENGGITLSFRTAVRVAITVPGDITKELAFTGLVVKPLDSNKLRFSTGLKNNGNVSLDTNLQLGLKTLWGAQVGSAGGVFPVLARHEAAFNFEVDKPFWGGWYTVSADATYDADVAASIGESGKNQTIKSQAVTIFVAPQLPALLIEIALVASLLGGGLWFTLHRLHYKKLHSTAKMYTVTSGDTVQSIAKRCGASWQTIAKLNKLKAPYHIEPEQRLKIPHK